jgi:CheY-like chemotaxis protein
VPANRVLLVDHDVDSLAELATMLRSRGLKVSLANGSQMACERAKTGGYDVVIAAREVAEPPDGTMGVIDALSVELPQVPPLIVLVDDAAEATHEGRIRRRDLDGIVARIETLADDVGNRPPHPSLSPSSHSLDHVGVADLMIVLATERRSGTHRHHVEGLGRGATRRR